MNEIRGRGFSLSLSCCRPQGADFQRFHLERLLTVQVYQQVTAGDKTPLNTDIVCFRGFEAFRTRESTKSFQRGRIAHTLNIVQEHTLQRLLSINNPERLRQLSMSRSNQDLLQAQTRAAFDEIEAYPASCLQRGQVLSSFPLDPGASVKSLFANELILLKDSIGKEMFTPKAVVRAA